MCGIVGLVSGYTNGFSTEQCAAFEQLLYIDALRGEDATGIAGFLSDGEAFVTKEAAPASVFLGSPEYSKDRATLLYRGKAVIGHNRKKTVGGGLDTAAHPFLIDNNTLFVHNGTLSNFYHLKTTLKQRLESIGVHKEGLVPDTDVDSHYLGLLLGMCRGEPDKIATILSNIDGAYACVWIDQEKETLYLVRNSQRPLWIAHTESGIVWSSEASFLYTALSRNHTKIEKVVELPVGVLVSIDLSAERPLMVETPLDLKKREPPVIINNTIIKNTKKKKSLVGTIGYFYIDDFVERSLYGGKDGGFYVWGENTNDYGSANICRASVLDISTDEIYTSWVGALVSGTITKESYTTTGGLELFFEDLKTVPKSMH